MARKLSAENIEPATKAVFAAILVELAALRAANALLLAKLDADAGVTDTDFAATVAPAAATISA